MEEPVRLSRRERQIMDVIYARGKATASEVWGDLPDPPSRTAVRTLLRILEDKGHLAHTQQGREYVYHPLQQRKAAGQSAMRRVVRTFFGGSLEKAVAAHLSDPNAELSKDDLQRLQALIRDAKKRGSGE